jgi:hypothetical protein
MKKYSKHIIASFCFVIIIARLIFPTLNFDSIALTLLGIAFLAIIIPHPDKIFERTKKIKFGSLELELTELYKTAKKVEKNLNEHELKFAGIAGHEHPYEFDYEITHDLPTEILKISIEIEKTLRTIYQMAFKTRENRPLEVSTLIDTLHEKNAIDYEPFRMLKQFFAFKSNIIYAEKYTVTDKEYLAFADIGIKVLKILKTLQNNISDGTVNVHILI